MKIGFLAWEYPPRLVGGLGTYASYITREYIKKGHDVTLFTLNPGNLKTHEMMAGVDVHRPLLADASNIFPLFVTDDVRRWGAGQKFFYDVMIYNILSATKFVNQLVRKEAREYDVLCAHDWLSSVAGIVIENELKIPMVFHVHSTEWGRSGGNGSRIVGHLEETSARIADLVVTVSHAMKDDLKNHSWDESKIRVIWNGVDPTRYSPGAVTEEEAGRIRDMYGIQGDGSMLLFVGRLTAVKGVSNLIRALPKVVERFPKTKLVILGIGEEYESLIGLTAELGIQERVVFRTEFVEEKERITHYAASDLCILPSTYEPFGIVSLEAMAMAKPVIVGARGVTGFREQVIPEGPEQCGLHVNGGDPSDIARAIGESLSDPDRARRWGEKGRERAQNEFSWEKAAEGTLEVYEEAILRKRRGRQAP